MATEGFSFSNAFQAYNSEDSWLPFFIPLGIWISTFVYCYAGGKSTPTFHKWYTLHNFHNFGAIFLGLISMYFNDDTMFNERIPILWSIGYFLVDLVDCLYRCSWDYLFHAVCCLVLGFGNYLVPLNRQLRMNSKASLCELSNPFMHWAKKTRKPAVFITFTAVFTLVRIIWLPTMAKQIYDAGMTPTHPVLLLLGGFYMLNLFWYAKMIRIIVMAAMGKSHSDGKTE